jgi:hypothetical protein
MIDQSPNVVRSPLEIAAGSMDTVLEYIEF